MGLIGQGTLKPGDRIPSIRTMSRQLRVSINTVKEAYELLETRRLVSARPQSGYYVAGRLPEVPREKAVRALALAPAEVTNGALLHSVMRQSFDPTLLPLGLATPDPALLPVERLTRMMASQARVHGSRGVSYLAPPGDRRLREQIARRALAAGCDLRPDEIVITAGCLEGVSLALRALCRPGDTVAVESPTFFAFLQLLESLGLRVLEIPATASRGISIEALRFALESNTVRACLVSTNFSNPLGALMADEQKRELVDLLARKGVTLIEDDINGDLSHFEPRPSVARARNPNVILCSSFSKTLAPGYRVGWVAAGALHEEIERLKFITSIATASPTQMAIAEFLENGGYERHLRTIRRAYGRNVASLNEAIGRSFPEGTRVTRPQGGCLLWVELPEEVDSLDLYHRALKRGVSIAPGALFSSSGRAYANYLRLSAATWNAAVEQAAATLGSLAAACVSHPGGARPAAPVISH
jgi:DNA-binding transcriptional MocR family regulator